jgi:gamma-glutamyltranspeptidase / glutathione hydrolase
MLRRGGNAFDAAIAAALAEEVVQPFYSGLGGGGFLVGYVAARKEVIVLDFREVAPGAATQNMFLRDGKPDPARSLDGALSIAVPGAPRGYEQIEREYGKLGLRRVAEPAIQLAENGFAVTPLYRSQTEARTECLARDPDAGPIFLTREADRLVVPALGQKIIQRDLARTLRSFAADGAAPFYRGGIARRIVEDVRKKGGILDMPDLEKYVARARKPLWGSYRGYRIATMPPPSGGGVTLLAILGAMEGLDLSKYRTATEIHYFVEAAKQVSADRATWFGDPDFVDTNLGPFATPSYAALIRSRIDPARARPSSEIRPVSASDLAAEGGHTTHISVIDSEGNAAAITTTVNFTFGSCVVAHGTGILMNDEMDDFAQAPGTPNVYGLVTGKANAVAPGKVPLSSMVPTLVFQKDKPDAVYVAIGSPGGAFIPTSVTWSLINLIDHHMPIDRAIAATRVHHQYLPDTTFVEPPGLEASTMEALATLGHHLEVTPRPWCDVEAVVVDPVTGWRQAASDPRWEGRPSAE